MVETHNHFRSVVEIKSRYPGISETFHPKELQDEHTILAKYRLRQATSCLGKWDATQEPRGDIRNI